MYMDAKLFYCYFIEMDKSIVANINTIKTQLLATMDSSSPPLCPTAIPDQVHSVIDIYTNDKEVTTGHCLLGLLISIQKFTKLFDQKII